MAEEQEKQETPSDDGSSNFISESSEPEFVIEEEAKKSGDKAEGEKVETIEKDAGNSGDSNSEEKKEDSGNNAPEEKEANETRKVSRSEKRIKQLVSKSSAAERRAEKAELELERIKSERQVASQKSEATIPDESQYDDYEEYLSALDKYDERAEKAKEAKAVNTADVKSDINESKLSDSQLNAVDIIKESIENYEKPKDFEETVYSDDFVYSTEFLEAISTCDNPAEVMYRLAKDKDAMNGFIGKTVAQTARDLVKIEDGFNNVKPVKKSSAPEPIKPVGGSDSQDIPDSELSFSEYEKRANLRERKRTSHY